MSAPGVALDGRTLVAVSRGQVHCELSGSIVILDRARSGYFEVDNLGARIWQLIQEPKSFAEICETLMSEYDVSAEECTSATQRFLEQLRSHGLVEFDGQPAS